MSIRRAAVTVGALLLVASVGAPAAADHTDPRQQQAPNYGYPEEMPAEGAHVEGAGTWEHIANFPPNPGTDLKTFRIGRDWYSVSGTFTGGPTEFVGQRFVRLTTDGEVRPDWIADHGSAHCPNTAPNTATGQQHDVAVAPAVNPKVIIDANDAAGRCHDTPGGGLEIVDVSRIEDPEWKPREIHLTRHPGTSHNVTVDATRPWIVYNSSASWASASSSLAEPWIDVLDIRSCLGPERLSLEVKRQRCRPKVFRIPFKPEWSQQRDWNTGELVPETEAACHDITATPGRIYCAALAATLIFDVRNLTDSNGNIRGRPLECPVIDGTETGAKVTDCMGTGEINPGSPAPGDEQPNPPQPSAKGWRLVGTFNHPGRACAPPPAHVIACNGNFFVPADEGVSVSHEADPVMGGRYMIVTDERGGGIIPPSSSCTPGLDNPIGNGGAHVFDLRNPAKPRYALTPGGEKAVYLGTTPIPAGTFCNIHRLDPIAGESRFLAAYYVQGTKIVDYYVDRAGRWTFDEVASYALPGANTWTVSNFLTERNPDGTRTYYFVASDIQRGIDVFSWTGPPNPASNPRVIQAPSPAGPEADVGLLLAGAVGIPASVLIRRRRERAAPTPRGG